MASISLNVDEFDNINPLDIANPDCLAIHCRAFLGGIPEENGERTLFSQDTLYLHGKQEILRALAMALMKATEPRLAESAA